MNRQIWRKRFFLAAPIFNLVLVTSGTVQVDEREIHGSWITHPIHEDDWFLTPAGGEPYALRWKSLSTDPLQTLHLHLSADLFARTVQQVVDRDPMHVMVQERTGFQDPLLAYLGLSLLVIPHYLLHVGPYLASNPASGDR